MQQHRIGPWRLVRACERLQCGVGQFIYTFVHAHESAPREVIGLVRGYGANEAEAVLDAASRIDEGAALFPPIVTTRKRA